MSANLWNRPLCDCGHDSGQHAAGGSHSPFMTFPCLVKDCDCPDFRMVGEQGQDYEADRGDAA
jgi:hypothetical protein